MAKVLIIEDEVPLARLLAWLLSDGGHDVTVAAHIPAAVVEAVRVEPDVVVFNTPLPVEEKARIIDDLRAEVEGVRIIDLATQAERTTADVADGADLRLNIPFHPDDFVQAVGDLAQQRLAS